MLALLLTTISVLGTFSILMATFSNFTESVFMADVYFSLLVFSVFLMVALILTVSLYLLKAFKFEKKLKNKLSKMSVGESRKYIENLEDYEIEPKIKSVLVTFLKQKLPEKRIARMLLNEMSEKPV